MNSTHFIVNNRFKKIVFFFYFLAFSTTLFAQIKSFDPPAPQISYTNLPYPQLRFTYDDAGNQVKRVFTYSCTGCKETVEAYSMYTLFQNSIKIYPNPTQGLFYIEWDKHYSHVIANIHIQSYNANYSQIISFDTQNAKANFDLSTKPAGIYFVKFSLTNGASFSNKIVKL